MQKYDQVHYPVLFVSRTFKANELNYNVTEQEVLALLRILDLGYNLLVGRSIQVLTRHSTLAWLFRSPGLQGRLGQLAALLTPWTLEIRKYTKGEDETLGAIAASITPREEVDRALTAIASRKEPRCQIRAPVPTIETDENRLVMSFDGSARVKRGGGAYSAIVWKLPDWSVVTARSGYAEGLAVNEAEYHAIAPVATRSARSRSNPTVLSEVMVRELRIDRIKKAQVEEMWISGMKKYILGNVTDLTQNQARLYGNLAADYKIDDQGLLFYCPSTRPNADRDHLMRPVVAEPLYQDILHHYHTSLEEGEVLEFDQARKAPCRGLTVLILRVKCRRIS
ncbi:unnamed protein product [Phytophthora fragariaefolia]|uniref:Unnamed protein product n=1 Tax=Phytophthora fragariaefolia TaxID=1490495 RepID=A0A9W7CNL1_9STRA|nr:unnamed protein product [Phytophthora fragariaefolia]